jgi:excisionase family DNA binding protein
MNSPNPCGDGPNDAELALDAPLLTPKDAAALLTVRPSWVYEAVRGGKLPHIKLGKHIRFLRGDLEQWLLEHRQGG